MLEAPSKILLHGRRQRVMDAKDERIAALEAEVGRLKQEISHLKQHDEKKPGKAQGPKSFWLDFIAGGISGAIAKTLTAPLEYVKLVLQDQDSDPRVASGELPRYKGVVDCVVRTAREDGLGAFWRGNLTNVLRYFPTQLLNFVLKDTVRNLFPKIKPSENFAGFFMVNVCSGGLAGAVSLAFVYPMDYARTRLVTDRDKFSSMSDCIAKTGLGCYDGFAVSVAGIFPFRAAYFAVNDWLVARNPYQKRKDLAGMLSKFVCGQVAALSAAYASYPFDTVRRRLQRQAELPRELQRYSGSVDCCRTIYRDEGLSGFFAGALMNALRTVGSALVLVVYGEVKSALMKKRMAMKMRAAEQAREALGFPSIPVFIDCQTGTKDAKTVHIALRVIASPLADENEDPRAGMPKKEALEQLLEKFGSRDNIAKQVIPAIGHEVVKRVFAQYSVEEFFQKRAQISEQIRKEVKQTDVFKLMFLQDCSVTKFDVVQP